MHDRPGFVQRSLRGAGATLYAFVRPWPLHPLTALPMVIFFGMWTGFIALLYQNAGAAPLSLLQITASILLPLAALLVVYLIVWRILGPYQAPSWPMYYLIVVGTSVGVAMIRLSTLENGRSQLEFLSIGNILTSDSPITTSIRIIATLLLINAIFGWFAIRLHDQVRQTQDALDLAKEQQRRLVQADESTRLQVAQDLHDHIQSPLVLIGMQLEQVAQRSSKLTGEELRSIADEVEYVRGKRLHEVIEGLAPDYALIGLRAALEGLQGRYERGMKVTITLDDRAVIEVEKNLTWTEATYRITEQALLNSVIHGQAQGAAISLSWASSGVVLRITDDGVGLTSQSIGLGTTITDAWVQQTEAVWSRTSSPEGGVTVRVDWSTAPDTQIERGMSPQ